MFALFSEQGNEAAQVCDGRGRAMAPDWSVVEDGVGLASRCRKATEWDGGSAEEWLVGVTGVSWHSAPLEPRHICVSCFYFSFFRRSGEEQIGKTYYGGDVGLGRGMVIKNNPADMALRAACSRIANTRKHTASSGLAQVSKAAR